MVLGQKLGFDHSFLFASHPLLSNTSVVQPMCKENKGGLFARMHPTNCHKVEAASQRGKKGTNACFLQPFQARYFYPPPPKQHLLYFSNPQSFSAHPPTSLVLCESYKCWAEWIHGTHAPESTPPSPGRRCSFNARISHGVKYPHQLLQLQTPPHKIHNLQLLQGGKEGEKGKLYQIGVERAAVKAGTSSRRILRWWRGKRRVLYN